MTVFLTRLFILSTIAIVCNGKISDQRLCADANCATALSYARTLLRYVGDDPRLLAFPPNAKVTVFSKSAGSRPDLWGVEINGKRGYAPMGLIKEERILIAKPDVIVATEVEETPQYNIASSVSPTEAYEVADGTTLFYDDVGTATVSVGNTALPQQASPLSQSAETSTDEAQAVEIATEPTASKINTDEAQGLKTEEVKATVTEEAKATVTEEAKSTKTEEAKTSDSTTDKASIIEEHREEVQEEGSAQRLYHYITSLLPSEGSGFLSSAEKQDDEDDYDEEDQNASGQEEYSGESEEIDFKNEDVADGDKSNQTELFGEEPTPSIDSVPTDVQIPSDDVTSPTPDRLSTESIDSLGHGNDSANRADLPPIAESETVSQTVSDNTHETMKIENQAPHDIPSEEVKDTDGIVPTHSTVDIPSDTPEELVMESIRPGERLESEEPVKPEKPIADSTEHKMETVEPTMQSVVEPTTESIEHVIEPVETVEPSIEHVEHTTIPAEPVEPTMEPVKPTFEPVEPTFEPVESTFESVEPLEPVAEHEESVEPTSDNSDGYMASFLDIFSFPWSQVKEEEVEEMDRTDEEPHQERTDEQWSYNAIPPALPSFGSEDTDTHPFELTGSYYGILTIAITAMAVLVFTLGYYKIENSRQDAQYVGKINTLEKSLYVTSKECLQLREELATVSNKVDKRAHQGEEVNYLQSELKRRMEVCQVLEDQVSILTAEVEAATEAGEDLSRMLRDCLKDDMNTSTLRASVDSLQEQLAFQQTTISVTNNLLFNKNLESDLQREEVRTLKSQLEKTKLDLAESRETCHNLRGESKRQEEDWTRNHAAELAKKQDYVVRLENQVTSLEDLLGIRVSEIAVLKQAVETINKGESLQEMLEFSELKARLEKTTKQAETLKDQLEEEVGARKLLEDHVKVVTREIIGLRDGNALAEKEKAEAVNKLNILKTYFEEKEAVLQKDIDMHETMFRQKSGDADSSYKHILSLQEQVNHFKSQMEIIKKECVDQERDLKDRLYGAENKAHENWVAFRQAERKCEEMKQEAAILRNRLTLVETQLNKSNQMNNDHMPMPNDRVPLEGNGEMHMSPLHMHYMDQSYSPRPYMPPPLYEPDQRLPPLGCLPTAPLPPPGPAYSRPRHYEPQQGFRPLPPHSRHRRAVSGSNSSGNSSGSMEKSGSRKQSES